MFASITKWIEVNARSAPAIDPLERAMIAMYIDGCSDRVDPVVIQ